jgi:hypothetical protein
VRRRDLLGGLLHEYWRSPRTGLTSVHQPYARL